MHCLWAPVLFSPSTCRFLKSLLVWAVLKQIGFLIKSKWRVETQSFTSAVYAKRWAAIFKKFQKVIVTIREMKVGNSVLAKAHYSNQRPGWEIKCRKYPKGIFMVPDTWTPQIKSGLIIHGKRLEILKRLVKNQRKKESKKRKEETNQGKKYKGNRGEGWRRGKRWKRK